MFMKIKLPKKKTRESIRNWLLENDMPTEELARRSGLSTNKIREWRVLCDVIDLNDAVSFKAWVKFKDYTTAESCVILGITRKSFIHYCEKHGLKKKSSVREPEKHIDLPKNGEELSELLKLHGTPTIAKMAGVSRSMIQYLQRKFNVESPRKTKKNKYNNKEWLHKNYVEKEYNIFECAEMAGVSYVTIYNWLIENKIIPRRGAINSKYEIIQ